MTEGSSDRPMILVIDNFKANGVTFAPICSSTVDSRNKLSTDGTRISYPPSSNRTSRKDLNEILLFLSCKENIMKINTVELKRPDRWSDY